MIDIETSEKDVRRPVKLIPLEYIDALLALEHRIGEGAQWMVTGNLGEALRTVDVEPECIEIIATKEAVQKIFLKVEDLNPTSIELRTERLPRNAAVEAKEYPVSVRSYYFEFYMNSVPVRVYGDLQIQIANWDWGDKITLSPDFVSVVGRNISVMPLKTKLELYEGLGWTDKVEQILSVLDKKRLIGR